MRSINTEITGNWATVLGGALYNNDQDPLFKNPGLFSVEDQWFFDSDYVPTAQTPRFLTTLL